MKISRKHVAESLMAMLVAGNAFAAKPNPDEILVAAEKIRNPEADYSVEVHLKNASKKSGKKNVTEKKFETIIKGREKALVKYLAPATDQGKQILMVADDMWIYMPTSAKPIRISPKQKVSGNAAYGDITRLNFVGNYDVSYKKLATYKAAKAHVLELVAKAGKAVTYKKIEYWIAAKGNRPLKTIYQTAQGKALKVGYFANYQDVFGVMRPTKFTMVDKINKNNVTTLVFKDAKKRKLPDLMFRKQNLGRG